MSMRTEALRAEMIRLKQSGLSQVAIAGMVGKSQAYVSQLLRAPPPVQRATARGVTARRSAAERGKKAMLGYWDNQETDLRMDIALGAPDDLSRYQDCIDSARYEGARRRLS